MLQLESSRTDYLQILDSRLETNATRLVANFGELKSQLASVKSDLETKGNAIEEKLVGLSDSHSKTREILAATNSELRKVEEFMWEQKDIPDNILITQTQGLDSATMAKNDFQILGVLERMQKTIEQEYIGKNRPLDDEFVIKTIKRAIENEGVGNEITVANIQEKLKIASTVKAG